MKWSELDRQPCSVARALAVIGDRWTLLVLRECFMGVRRFDAFRDRLGVSKAILSDRLNGLVREGVLIRQPYADAPPRCEYRLSEQGLALYPVIMALADWGNRFRDNGRGAPILHTHRTCGCDFAPRLTCSCCAEEVRARDVDFRAGPGYPDGRASAATAAGEHDP